MNNTNERHFLGKAFASDNDPAERKLGHVLDDAISHISGSGSLIIKIADGKTVSVVMKTEKPHSEKVIFVRKRRNEH